GVRSWNGIWPMSSTRTGSATPPGPNCSPAPTPSDDTAHHGLSPTGTPPPPGARRPPTRGTAGNGVTWTSAPEGRKQPRVEARNSETPSEKKPPWIKITAKMGPEYSELQALVKKEGLNTVCQEAGCPNIYECWEDREATFLIGG